MYSSLYLRWIRLLPKLYLTRFNLWKFCLDRKEIILHSEIVFRPEYRRRGADRFGRRERNAFTPLVRYSIKRRGNDKGDTMNYTLGRAVHRARQRRSSVSWLSREPIHAIIYWRTLFCTLMCDGYPDLFKSAACVARGK